MPQPPQLRSSVVVVISQPLSGELSQSAKPTSHVAIVQALVSQAATAFVGSQTRLQAPQFAGSVVSGVSQPSLPARRRSPLQSPIDASHTATQLRLAQSALA